MRPILFPQEVAEDAARLSAATQASGGQDKQDWQDGFVTLEIQNPSHPVQESGFEGLVRVGNLLQPNVQQNTVFRDRRAEDPFPI